jgi:CopG-like RHH_1 or ribbon-helix-helix domain, RHH_5
MSEPSEERSPADLLLSALDQLPPEDRKRVLAWLLGGGHIWARAPLWLRTFRAEPPTSLPQLSTVEAEALMVRSASLRGEHQTVPVRLPTDLYKRLRDWCQEQGFSMATVIRGLVARFLDQRGAQPPEKPSD